MRKIVKPLDIVIIILLALISFIPILIFTLQQTSAPNSSSLTAQVSVDGEVIASFPLTEDTEYTYTFSDGDYNSFRVEDDQICIYEASCPDQLCVKQGWISQAGETIVCLPHKLVVEIIADDGSRVDGHIY